MLQLSHHYVIMWEFIYDHYIILTLLLVWLVSIIYFRVTRGICRSQVRMDGKTVIITGCDSGIGKHTAFALARKGARVIMACVRVEQAQSVRETIVEETGNSSVVVKHIDLSSMSSVRQFAEEINSTESRLDVLIHNAGVLCPPDQPVTDCGLNVTLATNTYGPFLLTHLLIDLLKRTSKSRIVFVSSSSYAMGHVDLDNPNPMPGPSSWTFYFNCKMYFNSKLAVVLLAKELHRRLEESGSGVTVNYLHPGVVATTIIWTPRCFRWTVLIVFPFVKTKEQGAQTTIYLAVSEEVEGVSGKYFVDCKEEQPARRADDENLAKQLWTVCEDIVELKPSEPHI